MNYVLLLIVLLAAIHSFTFGRWLHQNGQPLGATTVFLLIAVSLVLPIYRIITTP